MFLTWVGKLRIGKRTSPLCRNDEKLVAIESQSGRIPLHRDSSQKLVFLSLAATGSARREAEDGNGIVVRLRHKQTRAIGREGEGIRSASLMRSGRSRIGESTNDRALRGVHDGDAIGAGRGYVEALTNLVEKECGRMPGNSDAAVTEPRAVGAPAEP